MMTRDEIERALFDTERRIVGLRISSRRQYGTTEKSANSAWPTEVLSAMAELKNKAKAYRAMLADLEPTR